MRCRFLIFSFLLITFFLTGCSLKKEAVIGLITYNEDDFLNGAHMYSDENLQTVGRNIKIIEKKADKNENAADIFNELKQEGADLIISDMDNGFNKFYAEEAVPVIAAREWNHSDNTPYCFELSPNPTEEAQYLADFIADELKIEGTAVIYNSEYDYSNILAESFNVKMMLKGADILSVSEYKSSDSVYDDILKKIAESKPSLLLVLDNSERSAKIVDKACEIMVLKPIFVGPCQWDTIESKVSDPSVLEGSYCLSCFSYDDARPEIQIFVDDYKQKYNKAPSLNSAMGYDSMAIAFDALKNTKRLNEKSLVETLLVTDYEGISGRFDFNGKNYASPSVFVSTIMSGEKVLYSKLEN